MKKRIFIFLYVFLLTQISYSQCPPQFYDFDGNLSSSPEWIVCDGNDFFLSLRSNVDIGNYSIDWGDGSAISLVGYINQLCTDTFTTSISVYPNVSSNFLSDTLGCSPLNVDFYNLSVGAENYIWDFGNGETGNSKKRG